MADNEDSSRVTPVQAKKRPSSGSPQAQLPMAYSSFPDPHQPNKKKRIALSELPISTNALVANPNQSTLKRKKKELDNKEAPNLSPVADELVQCDINYPQCAKDIYDYLRTKEADAKRRPLPNFIDKVQTDVTAHMRGILVDWLVDVTEEFKLVPDTLHLTISYIDRFLSFNPLNRHNLQLLGVSAMLIASKYEEITPPHIEDFCYITDNAYTKQEIVKMESDIRKSLNIEVGDPTIKTFLRRFIKVGQDETKYSNLKLEFLANYIAELSLLDYGCVEFLPSTMAASAIFVARLTLDPDSHPWSSNLQLKTKYKLSELKDCIKVLHELQLNKRKSFFTAIREKYNQHKFKFVSSLVPPLEISALYFEGF